MISLAQRVRDFRYSKGWGPDELANRAEISRTALYQIESGKTGLPRAGTLRRIAVALDVSMDELLGDDDAGAARPAAEASRSGPQARGVRDWLPAEGAPLTLPAAALRSIRGLADERESLRAMEPAPRASASNHEGVLMREGELMSKLHDLLHSPVGAGVARILDELHGLIPRARHSG
jgi:transcriptional regulator with XRE-family HTH domain